ncbi:hypothetical protein Lser_V15G29196 [Lactuca serriola]
MPNSLFHLVLEKRSHAPNKTYLPSPVLWSSLPKDISTMSAPIKSSTITTAVSCNLTYTNFLLWKAQVVPILQGVHLFGHLNGTILAPLEKVTIGTGDAARESPNPDYDTWAIQDQFVVGCLLSSMTEEGLPQLTRCTNTAKELWTTLHTIFSAQHRGKSIQTRTQLSTTRKCDMSADKYYQKMTGFANTMENIGQPMGVEEVIGYILAGLGPGHSNLFTAIAALSNEHKVTLPEFYSYLIAHEAQATSMNTTVEYTSSANNATRHEPNAPRRNNNNEHNNSNQRNNYFGGSGRGLGRNNGGL